MSDYRIPWPVDGGPVEMGEADVLGALLARNAFTPEEVTE